MESVLIVDNDMALSRSLELHLQLKKYNAISVCNGKDGLALANKWKPDFILVDRDFPDTEFLRDIQAKVLQDEMNCKVVIIGNDIGHSRIAVKENQRSGVHGYLSKPFRLDDLFSVLQDS